MDMNFTRPILLCTILLLLAVSSVADVVYLRDGRTFEGTVSREDGKVIVEHRRGRKVIEEDLVLHIEVSSSPEDTSASPQTPQPTSPARPADTASLPGGVSPEPDSVVGLEQAGRAEPIIFLLMRRLEQMPAGMQALQIRQKIERWRIVAHDRKRRAGDSWLSPDDFQRRRAVHLALLNEAEELHRKAASLERIRDPNPQQEAQRKGYELRANQKLKQAAATWADPTLRNFLMGAASLALDDLRAAEAAFRRARKDMPLVAAFAQGQGLAMLASKREIQAVEAFSDALRLRPDSSEIVEQLREAMRQTPGALIQTEPYLEAASLLEGYDKRNSRRNTQGTFWALPGRDVHVREGSLPTPPYDRLSFRQGVGVPIGEGALLVDENAVRDALEVYVRLPNGEVIAAEARRGASYRRGSRSDAPLSVVTVAGARFRPISPDPNALQRPGTPLVLRTIDSYAAMGPEIRNEEGKVLQVKDGAQRLRISVSLLPGEAAGAILTNTGLLAGFVAPRLDEMADSGGERRVITLDEIEPQLRQTRTHSRSHRFDRRIEPRSVEGDCFVVVGIFGERLSE
jgi:tetratricopeptide (TPR) repeat protein